MKTIMNDVITMETIFEELGTEEKFEALMKEMDSEIREGVAKMVNFYGQNDKFKKVNRLSIDDIVMMFKSKYCEAVFDQAITMEIGPKKSYNIASNVEELLNAETVRKAMIGWPMLNAIANALRILEESDNTKCNRCPLRKLLRLRKKEEVQ